MTATKQITFEGREYTVPAWVEWVARDKNGKRFGYLDRPSEGDYEFIHANDTFVCIDDISDLCFKCDWRDSLTKV